MFNRAKWIWQNTENNADEYVKFYDEFEYFGGTVNLSISCDSNYSVWVNGRLVGFSQYPDYPHYKVCDDIDLGGHALAGTNKLMIAVWYYGESFSTYQKGNAGLLYEIRENSTVRCCSGTGTLCKIAGDFVSYIKKEITTQLGFSFRYDARLYDGYDKPDFVPKDYRPAVVVTGISYALYKRPCKRTELSENITGRQVKGKRNLYDLGKETCGFLSIRYKAGKGTVLNVAYGQHIDDGGVRRIIQSRDFSVELVGSGEWFSCFNTFRRLAGRYLEVSADSEFQIEYIGIREVSYPIEKVPVVLRGGIRRSIYDTAVRTLHLCMHEHYEDTPWREQALYTMDSRNQMLCGYVAFKEYTFARANLLLMAKGKKKGKLLPLCFPARDRYTIPAFSLAYILAVNEYGIYSGDDAFVIRIMDILYDIAGLFLDKRHGNGLVPALFGQWNFYEWSDSLSHGISPTEFGAILREEMGTRYDVALNCMLIIALQNLDAIHKRLGMREKYGGEIAELQAAVRSSFYDEKTGCFRSYLNVEHYSKLCNSLAVLSGSAEDIKHKICKKITSCPAPGETVMTETTLAMKAFEYDALLYAGGEVYREYILNEIDENYGNMLKKGATSFWETIKGADDFGGAGSLCHGWSAIPVYYYHKLGEIQAENAKIPGGSSGVISKRLTATGKKA